MTSAAPMTGARPHVRTWGTATLATLLWLCAASMTWAQTPSPEVGAEPMQPSEMRWLTERFVELSFDNPRVTPPVAPAKVRILLPRGWKDSTRDYPAVLLLHGAGDRFDGWTEKHDGWPTTLEEFTADQEVVVVMPDGGTSEFPGWYSDWFNGGDFGPPQWETWHIAQLLPWVKDTFPVRDDRGGWVVAGLSMGGFGAMSYLARHPDEFAAGFSFSGALNTLPEGEFIVPPGVWGNAVEQEVRIRGHNPPDLVDNLRDAAQIWFRTGQGLQGGPAPKDSDPVGTAIEAGAWQTNETFDRALHDAGLEHHYDAYPQGGHNWWHWHDGLQTHAWPVITDLFARQDIPDIPNDFHYRTIEPAFEIYGWEITVERDVVEFLTLDDVDAQDLTITGSGTVTVRTPPLYAPDTIYSLDISGSPTAETNVPTVTADTAGRLQFAVTLGPSHQHQQFTAEQRAAEASSDDYWQRAEVSLVELPISPPGRPSVPPPSSAPSDQPQSGEVAADTTLPATGAGGALVGLLGLAAAVWIRRS